MGDQLLSVDIGDLNLSVRSFNCLKRVGWNTIGDILESIENWQDLLRVRNLGRTSAVEIIKALIDYQTSLLKELNRTVVVIRNASETITLDDADKDISELNLSVRSYNSLRRAGYSKVGKLKEDIRNGLELRKIRNIGSRSKKEILLTLGYEGMGF